MNFRLIDWANKHWGIMLFLGCMPAILVVFFVFFYMSSLSQMVAVLSRNAGVSSMAVLAPVEGVLDDKVLLEGPGDFEAPVGADGFVYWLWFNGPMDFEFRDGEGNVYRGYGSLLVDGVSYSVEDGYRLEVLGNSVGVTLGGLVCEVWKSGELFCVTAGDLECEGVPGLGVWLEDGRCLVDTGFGMDVPADGMLYYVPGLAGGTLYMDILHNSYVSGVSWEFRMEFIKESGLPVVMVTMLLLTVVMYFTLKYGKIKVFSHATVFKIDFVALAVLVLLAVFALFML